MLSQNQVRVILSQRYGSKLHPLLIQVKSNHLTFTGLAKELNISTTLARRVFFRYFSPVDLRGTQWEGKTEKPKPKDREKLFNMCDTLQQRLDELERWKESMEKDYNEFVESVEEWTQSIDKDIKELKGTGK